MNPSSIVDAAAQIVTDLIIDPVKYGGRGQSPITGDDGTLRYPVPITGYDDTKFKPANDFIEIASALIAAYDELSHLSNASLAFYWKLGNGPKGCKWLASASKASGLVAHLTGADFVITAYAKSCISLMMTAAQVEALVYHELRHCERDENDKWILVEHDWQGFRKELDRYGLWMPDEAGVAEAFRQLPLL